MIYAAITFTFIWVFISLYVVINSRRVKYLSGVPALQGGSAPSLAIIVAVRNEEKDLPDALKSMCELDYPNYRLVVVNDRSTDGSAAVLKKFAQQYEHLTVIQVDELPAGWLGKNHALYKGYEGSPEEWLLFTDADIRYAPDTLRKAVHYAATRQLDHLPVLPDVNSRSGFFNSIMDTFKVMLDIRLRPWEVTNPRSKAFIGVGAFNLVRRSSYEAIGTHKAIALRPDDDLKLGQAFKLAGFRQEVLYGDGHIGLEWYSSVKEFIAGLMKNTFSTVDYKFPMVIAGCVSTFIVFVLPLPLLLGAGGPAERILAGVILLFQVILFLFKRGMRRVWWYALMIPVAGSIMIYIIWVSAVRTIRQGGIYWRDSFYPLSELRKGVSRSK
jgi:glycosyltransferase involved in cell wall biosynthesis